MSGSRWQGAWTLILFLSCCGARMGFAEQSEAQKSAFAVDNILDRHSGLITVVIRDVQDDPPLLHTNSLATDRSDLRSAYRAAFRNSKTGETKDVPVPAFPTRQYYSGNAPPPEDPMLRAVRLRKDEGIAGQIAFSETALSLDARKTYLEYDVVDVLPMTLIFVVKDGKVLGERRSYSESGFTVPSRPSDENVNFTEEDGARGLVHYVDVNDLARMKPPVLSRDGAEVRVSIVLGKERAFLLVQAVSKDGLRLHLKSVEEMAKAIRVEAFDLEEKAVALPPQSQQADVPPDDVADDRQRSLLLRPNEAIVKCCEIQHLPSFDFITGEEGRALSKVVFTPKVTVFTADAKGAPVPFTGKVYSEPLVLNRVDVVKFRRLLKDLGFKSPETGK